MNKEQIMKMLQSSQTVNKGIGCIGWFPIDNMPAIAIPKIPADNSGNVLDFSLADVGEVLDLVSLKEQLIAVKDGDFFVIGRAKKCDHRWGFEEISKLYHEEAEAEQAYMSCKRTIDEIHCVIKKVDNQYILIDCSTTGTIMLSRRNS